MSLIFLAALLVLHTYWFLLFLKIDYNAMCKGVVEDIQHPIKVEDAKLATDKQIIKVK